MITTATLLALQLTAAFPPAPVPARTALAMPATAVSQGLAGAPPFTEKMLKDLQKALGLLNKGPFGVQAGISSGATICSTTADIAARAGMAGLHEDLLLGMANCINFTDPDDVADCLDGVWEDFFDGIDEAVEVHDARIALCGLLGEDAYDPDIDPANFVAGVDNPYFPLPAGATWMYEVELDDGGMETVVVTVEDYTKPILGIPCTVVRDVVTFFDDDEERDGGGELIEDTLDYYAQDVHGNVWYFGEIAMEFEMGELASLDGSWEAGKNFAKPGIIMQANPMVMQTYRQEWLLDEAEDAATVLSTTATATVPFAPPTGPSFLDCVQTADFTPLEPDVLEHKFYAPGYGLVLEVDPATGERLELVDFFLDAD